MKLKRLYTVSVDEELAQVIEDYKTETGKKYSEIFKEAIKQFLGFKE